MSRTYRWQRVVLVLLCVTVGYASAVLAACDAKCRYFYHYKQWFNANYYRYPTGFASSTARHHSWLPGGGQWVKDGPLGEREVYTSGLKSCLDAGPNDDQDALQLSGLLTESTVNLHSCAHH